MDRTNLSLLRRLAGRAGMLGWGLLLGTVLAFPGGCSREDRWWGRTTGVAGDALGFEDRWQVSVQGSDGDFLTARIRSADLARLDFAPGAGDYHVVYNHGRTVRFQKPAPREILVDRTLLLTYLLPFMNRPQLGEALIALGVDTAQVAYGVEWEGHRCIRVGATEPPPVGAQASSSDQSADRPAPAIFFDEETGAVLRLVMLSNSRLGTRVGEFRLSDHRQRAGAYLPRRLETWSAAGLRSALTQVATRDSVDFPLAMFQLPAPPEGLP